MQTVQKGWESGGRAGGEEYIDLVMPMQKCMCARSARALMRMPILPIERSFMVTISSLYAPTVTLLHFYDIQTMYESDTDKIETSKGH